VRQLLRERILRDFQDGEQFYSERDLIEKLRVSQPTIRRVLRDLIDEGYLVADPRRGYFVSRHSEARYVGIIQPATEPGSFPFGGVFSAACREKGFIQVSYDTHRSDEVGDILRMIRHKPSEECLLLAGLTREFTSRLGELLQLEGYRHALIGPKMSGFNGPSVFPDQDQEVNQILDYLTALGHERIIFMVNEPRMLTITSLRAEAVDRQLKERGLSKASLIWCDTGNWEDSFEAAHRKSREILATKPWPTAIVPLSGIGAWAVLRYAMENKIEVPGELSIVSFDPMSNANHLPIPMTELTFSYRECADIAIDLIWSDSPAPVHTNTESKLVVRKSSGPPPLNS
jgi:LacI family transcriptional regulator